MRRKTRRPHTPERRANIAAGMRSFHQRVREALAKVEQQ
jgi:hypothetical protein